MELYQLLGKREAQDEVRARDKEKRHCEMLTVSPFACLGCPKNPWGDKEETDMETSLALAAWGAELGTYAELGILSLTTPLRPHVVRAAILALDARRDVWNRNLSIQITNCMGEMLSKMFGG